MNAPALSYDNNSNWPIQQQCINYGMQQQYFNGPQQQFPGHHQAIVSSFPVTQGHHHLQNSQPLDMVRLQMENPHAFQLIQMQREKIEQDQIALQCAYGDIELLKKEVASLLEEKKKHEDKIPPVITVSKDEASSSYKDAIGYGSSCHSRIRKASKSALVRAESGPVTSDSSDSRPPLKKRAKRRCSSLPDIATAAATLAAATSPAFKRKSSSRFVY